MLNECSPESNENKTVRAVSHLVERMLWKISECNKEKQPEYLLKFFKFLGKTSDLASLWAKLIQYRAMLETKELENEVKEEDMEKSEDNLDDMFS